MSEEKKKSIEKIEKWLRSTSSLISEKVYGQVSGQVSEEENKEELLKQISKELYKDEWFIEKAIISYKSQQEKTYTFFKDNDKGNLITKYNWCQRPCDTNMSLCRFVINGEVEGYMSESLVSHFNNLKQIDLNEFIHHFVKPLIKENIEQQKEIEELKENQIWSEATIEGLKTDFIHKDKIRELLNKDVGQYMNFYREIEEILEE